MIGRDSTSLTIVTRHFGYTAAPGGALGLPWLRKGAGIGGTARIIVSKVLRALLLANGTSGFVPHADDWHFENLGSIISPMGNCGGMSASAIWYYLTKKSQGSPGLWGQFDNDPEDLGGRCPGIQVHLHGPG
jgi:hypothetical protein